MTRCGRCEASILAWTTLYRSTCCLIPATISTNAFCASSSVFRSERGEEVQFFGEWQTCQRVTRQRRDTAAQCIAQRARSDGHALRLRARTVWLLYRFDRRHAGEMLHQTGFERRG